jgi:xanthine dehydrogenase accessory factor
MIPFTRLAEISAGTTAAALCTVISTRGSTPRKVGARMVVFADGSPEGSLEGTVGGGAVEHRIRAEALEVIAQSRPRTVEVALTTELGMCCGGQMTLFIEPLRARPPLILLGGGHVAKSLCDFAHQAGFDVHVADPREELLTQERFPQACALASDYENVDLENLPFGTDAFVVVVTHDHQMDQRLVERVLTRPARYVAMVGSLRKASLTRERCLNKGLPPEDVERLFSPAGVHIGAETPEEIALSIVAQMVQVRRAAEGVDRRTRGATILPVDARVKRSS